MRRIYIVLLLGCGCGRLGFDDMSPGGSGIGSDQTTTNLVPGLCGAQAWTSVASDLDTDLSVAVMPGGVAVFGVSESSGPLIGFTVDNTGNLTSAAGGTTIRNDGPYTASAAAYVDNTLIAAVVSGSRVLINIVPADLSTYNEIANVDGEYVGKDALLDLTTDRMTPTSCAAGLTVNPFAINWTAETSQLSVTTAQTTGIAATPIDSDALVVWSTTGGCYAERVSDAATGVGSSQMFACGSPRLATDGSGASMLVFEASDGVRLGTINDVQLASISTLLVAGATSPRVVFDGTRYWISFLDGDGNISIGYLDANNNFRTATLSGTQPQHDAYEIAIVNGDPWVYSVDGAGYAGTHVCLVPG